MKSRSLFIESGFFCPLCNKYFERSGYLHGVFVETPRVEWLANMITHYRHEHINYYNNGVGYVSRFHNYDRFKEKVNNRVKRQLLRKLHGFLFKVGVTSSDFALLQGTDGKTMLLAEKLLTDGKIKKITSF